jgi:O-antigen ligase
MNLNNLNSSALIVDRRWLCRQEVLIMFAASLLVVLGDVRNVITPMGYWLLWGVWSCVSIFYHKKYVVNKHDGWGKSAYFKIFVIGSLLMIFGFIISALVNVDLKTFYQSIKIIIIILIGFIFIEISKNIDRRSIFLICAMAVLVSLSVYLLSKYIFTSYYILLGDGRQGSALSYPGVFWKTGAFFSIIAFGYFISSAKWGLRYLFIYLAGAFIVISDGSRTGFLWFIFSTALILFVRVMDKGRKFSFFATIAFGLILSITLTYLLIKISETVGGLSILALPLDRLTAGDGLRIKMLDDVLNQAEKCLPFGCGFGKAVTETEGESMVVHNAYLALLADVGVIGLSGFLIIIFGPFLVLVYQLTKSKNILISSNSYFTAAAALGVAGFAFTMAIHPYSTEMSEWGLFFLMTTWLFSKNEMTVVK